MTSVTIFDHVTQVRLQRGSWDKSLVTLSGLDQKKQFFGGVHLIQVK